MNVLGFITKPHFTIFLKQYFTIPSKDILDFALRMMWGEITSTLYKAFTLLPWINKIWHFGAIASLLAYVLYMDGSFSAANINGNIIFTLA